MDCIQAEAGSDDVYIARRMPAREGYARGHEKRAKQRGMGWRWPEDDLCGVPVPEVSKSGRSR